MLAARKRARDLRIAEVATKIEADIRRRKLKPGDAYLTTAQCATLLEVSTGLANAAMQLLSLRGLLHRSQRSGSRVGHGDTTRNAAVKEISLVFDTAELGERSGTGEEILGIQEIFPSATVNVVRLSATDGQATAQKLLQKAGTRAARVGFILWSVSLEIQRLWSQSGLPFILRGSPYPSLTGLSHIGRDSFGSGHRLATHAALPPCRSLLILMRATWRPGDNPFIDGALLAATEAGLPSGSIRIRGVRGDDLAIQAEVTHFLDTSPKGSSIIALMGQAGLCAHAAMARHPHGKATRLILADCNFEHPLLLQYAHLRYSLPHREVGRQAGALLAKVMAGTLPPEGEQCLLATTLNEAS